MRSMARRWFVAVAVLGLVPAAWADTVYLHDGQTIKGTVVSEPDALVVRIQTAMGPMEFRASLVARIEKGDGPAPVAPAPADQPGVEPATPVKAPVAPDSSAKDRFAETRRDVEKVTSGAEGAALWEQFLKDCPTSPQADLARKELVVWKERADKNMARFGPSWLPKYQVDERSAKADELVGQADGAASADAAAKLYDQASQQHPYRCDIPFKKAVRFYRDQKLAEFGRALGDVVKVDGNHVAARNNLGVMAAVQTQWSLAVMNLGKAAVVSENEVVLDNLDLVVAMAEKDGAPGQVVADCDRMIRQVVAQLHRAGKHTGENRWGNRWIKEEEYQRLAKENAEIDRQIIVTNNKINALKPRYVAAKKVVDDYEAAAKRLKELGHTVPTTPTPTPTPTIKPTPTPYPAVPLQSSSSPYGASAVGIGSGGIVACAVADTGAANEAARCRLVIAQLQADYPKAKTLIKDIETEVNKLRAENKAAESKKNVPPRAAKLILLDFDGVARLGAVEPKTEQDPKPAPKASDHLLR